MAVPSEIHKDFRSVAKELEEMGVTEWRKTRHCYFPIVGALHMDQVQLPIGHGKKSYGSGEVQAVLTRYLRILETWSPSTYRAVTKARSGIKPESNGGLKLDPIGQSLEQQDRDSPERSPRRPRDIGISQVRTSTRPGGRKHKLYTSGNSTIRLKDGEAPVKRIQIQPDGTEVEIGEFRPRKEILIEIIEELHESGVPYRHMAKAALGIDPEAHVYDPDKKRDIHNVVQAITALRKHSYGSKGTLDLIEKGLDRLTAPEPIELKPPLVNRERKLEMGEDSGLVTFERHVTHQGLIQEELTRPPAVPDRLLEALYSKLDEAIEPELIREIVDQIKGLEGR